MQPDDITDYVMFSSIVVLSVICLGWPVDNAIYLLYLAHNNETDLAYLQHHKFGS